MGQVSCATSTLHASGRPGLLVLLFLAAWIHQAECLAPVATRSPPLAFAPAQHLSKHVARSVARMGSAAAAGAMASFAVPHTASISPNLQPAMGSDGFVATAIASARSLPVLSTLASTAAYRGAMALSYDSFLAGIRKGTGAHVRLPAVLAAAAFTGLASAVYVSATRKENESNSYRANTDFATCRSPFAAPSRGGPAEIVATIGTEMVSYSAFFGLQHMVLSALPLLAGTWYGCAVSGAGTGLVSAMLAEQLSRKANIGGASLKKGEVATENFVFVGAVSAMRMALRAQ
mmetsp:Transcript_271/g.726  ORF Transcript_271/g.726 Transcript_271/m.726 type:complete len:290 (-) Transcript_271:172-1041(-)